MSRAHRFGFSEFTMWSWSLRGDAGYYKRERIEKHGCAPSYRRSN